jgi:hypothetical protein
MGTNVETLAAKERYDYLFEKTESVTLSRI